MNESNPVIEACIFDLDGVIVDTAKYHFVAWRNLANSLGFDFTEEENEKLKGVSRIDSLNLILSWGGLNCSDNLKNRIAAQKNEDYLTYIQKMTADEILPGVIPFLEELKNKGIKIALGSASKNAVTILNQVGLTHFFESIIDGTKVTNGKPHPEGFLKAANELKVAPRKCIVFEDAPKGVEAALRAEMFVVGIGRSEDLEKAHFVMSDFEGKGFDDVVGKLMTNVS